MPFEVSSAGSRSCFGGVGVTCPALAVSARMFPAGQSCPASGTLPAPAGSAGAAGSGQLCREDCLGSAGGRGRPGASLTFS